MLDVGYTQGDAKTNGEIEQKTCDKGKNIERRFIQLFAGSGGIIGLANCTLCTGRRKFTF